MDYRRESCFLWRADAKGIIAVLRIIPVNLRPRWGRAFLRHTIFTNVLSLWDNSLDNR